MDFRLTSAQATEAERRAVDAELGPPQSGCEGASRPVGEKRSDTGSTLKRDDRPPRHRLLPVLHAIQNHIGWISAGALNYVSQRMDIAPADVHGVASFYGMFSLQLRPATVLHVCDDIACYALGSAKICAELERTLGPAGSPNSSGRAVWMRSQCLGLCERAPAAMISCAGDHPQERVLAPATVDAARAWLGAALEGNLPHASDELNLGASVPQGDAASAGDAAGKGHGATPLRLLKRIASGGVTTLAVFERQAGYQGLRKALEIGAEATLAELSASKLLGRGGAAFPTAKKWEALLQQRPLLEKNARRAHYVVCNADESEPGTFKDRVLMEGDPFIVIEGMTIAGFVTGARQGYIYLRGEYPLAAERMQHAIDEARTNGLLGENILGRGFHFDVEIRRGAGAYICGEETALFNSIEGFRGEPRNKPPFPTQAGLFRQPTVVNNVETLANVPVILRKGGAAYAKLGTENSAGTRLFCLCGHVVRPGVYEVAMGTTLRHLVEMAGGVAGTGRLQAILLGGAAGAFITPQELDTPLTFEATRAIGATLGSGVVMLFDDTIDLREILLRIASFFRHETCGQCVPCRVGVIRQQEALIRLTSGEPIGSTGQEVALVREMGQAMRDASICGLGQTASGAIESALKRWSLFQ